MEGGVDGERDAAFRAFRAQGDVHTRALIKHAAQRIGGRAQQRGVGSDKRVFLGNNKRCCGILHKTVWHWDERRHL